MTTYVGHTDAVWDFKLFPVSSGDSCFLASASADGTVKIWDTQASGQLLKSTLNYNGVSDTAAYGRIDQDLPVPTSVDFCHTDLNKLAVSYSNAEIQIFDIETGQVVTTLKDPNSSHDGTPATQINKLVAHPTMPLIITGHEDRYIKFFDLKSGKCAFSMSAHLDAVSCLDVDPSGTALVSGGHDSSIRLWDISMSKTCMQEFSAHRRKGHEGVLSVQYHKLFPWMVRCPAEGQTGRQANRKKMFKSTWIGHGLIYTPSLLFKSNNNGSSRVRRSIVKGQDNTHQHRATRPVVGSEEWHQLRRENHKRVERKRRETINEQIAQLARLLPKCEKTNKGAILKEAVLYMENMRRSNDLIKQLQQQVEELKRENSQLKEGNLNNKNVATS
ncbi:hypothetical protein VTP01DRAFT_1316 [Rhizomucor pusillus]|uniref:uncharacterized protein n=1 Tax=Rhizomucor pusillus TaxID=4840 RepID=UPI003743F713